MGCGGDRDEGDELVGAWRMSVPHTASHHTLRLYRKSRCTIRYLSTAHRVAPHARSVPDIAYGSVGGWIATIRQGGSATSHSRLWFLSPELLKIALVAPYARSVPRIA
eukprot:3365680-Rhodomonas_salina.3